MRCPFCQSEDTQVVDTRSNPEANTIRRRRKCLKCDKRFTTYERVDLKMPRLVKKDGSRTDFDREKLTASMRLALRKRPVATEAVDSAVDRIEERLRALGEREIPTTRVGDLVMRDVEKAHPRREELRRLVDAARRQRGVREIDMVHEDI